jgi:hypothetical protein
MKQAESLLYATVKRSEPPISTGRSSGELWPRRRLPAGESLRSFQARVVEELLFERFSSFRLKTFLAAIAVVVAAMALLLVLASPQAQAQEVLPPETVAARQAGFPPPWPTLTQTASPDLVSVGEPVTFTITFVNNSGYDGDEAIGILPEGVTLASQPTQTTPKGGCEVNPAGLLTGDSSSRYFLCVLSPIPAGGSATATLTMIPSVPGTLTNTVQDFFGQQVQTSVTVLPSAEVPLVPLRFLGPGLTQAYIVQPGETLNELAERFGTSAEAIAQASGIDNPHLIFSGQGLSIPSG